MQDSDINIDDNNIEKIFKSLREHGSIFQHLSKDIIKKIFVEMLPLKGDDEYDNIYLIEEIIRSIFATNTIKPSIDNIDVMLKSERN